MDEQKLIYCNVHVDYEGGIAAYYKWTGNVFEGSEHMSEEDFMNWDDDEIIDHVLAMIGSEDKAHDEDKVKITRD